MLNQHHFHDNSLTEAKEQVMGLEYQLNNNIELVSDIETLKAVAASGPKEPTFDQRREACNKYAQGIEEEINNDPRLKEVDDDELVRVTGNPFAPGDAALDRIAVREELHKAAMEQIAEKCGPTKEELAAVVNNLNSGTPDESLRAIFKDVGTASKSDAKAASFSR